MKVYKLDLATLLPLLEEFRQSGALHTVLPANISGFKERCHVRIDLVGGKLSACSITSEDGSRRSFGHEALQRLQRLGVLQWRLEMPQESPNAIVQASPVGRAMLPVPYTPALHVPRRATYIEQSILNTLPRKHRRVVVLVDGERNVAKIAAMLFPTTSNTQAALQEVMDILRDLERFGLIVMT